MITIEHVTPENHNLLDDPIMADKGLQCVDGWRDAVSKIGELILAAGLQDVLSVRLVHRHHTLEPGQLMVEFQSEHRGGEALVTEVRHERDTPINQLIPNVMSITKNGFGAIEYCNPKILIDPQRAEAAIKNEKLLEKIRQLIISSKLERYIGIGLCNKSYFQRGAEDLMLIEVTDADGKANVLRWLPRKDINGRSIQTLWVFEDPKNSAYNNASLRAFCSWENHGSCMVYCIAACKFEGPGHAEYHESPHAPSEY